MWMCPRPWCAFVHDATQEDGHCFRCEEREEGSLRQGVYPLRSGSGRPNFREGHVFADCHVGKTAILDAKQAKVVVLDGHAGVPESYDLSIAAVAELSRVRSFWPMRAVVRSVAAGRVQLADGEAGTVVDLPFNPTLRGGRLDELFWSAHHSRVPPPAPLPPRSDAVPPPADVVRRKEGMIKTGELHAEYAREVGLPPDIVFPARYFSVYSEAERRRLEMKYANERYFQKDLNVDEDGVRYLTKETMWTEGAARKREKTAQGAAAPRTKKRGRSAPHKPFAREEERTMRQRRKARYTEEEEEDEEKASEEEKEGEKEEDPLVSSFPWAECGGVGARGKIDVKVSDVCDELRHALSPYLDEIAGDFDEYGQKRYRAVAIQSGGGKDRSDFWSSGKFWGYTGQPRVGGKFYRAGLFEEAEMAALASAAVRVDSRLRTGSFAQRRKFMVWLQRGGRETQLSWMKDVGLDGSGARDPPSQIAPPVVSRREGKSAGGITARRKLRDAKNDIAESLFAPWKNEGGAEEEAEGHFSDLTPRGDLAWTLPAQQESFLGREDAYRHALCAEEEEVGKDLFFADGAEEEGLSCLDLDILI